MSEQQQQQQQQQQQELTTVTVNILYVINDPPTALFEQYGGLQGMVQEAVKRIRNSDRYKHLDPFLQKQQIVVPVIETIHPYLHRFDKEAAAKVFPAVKDLFIVSSGDGEDNNIKNNKNLKKKYDCIILSGSKYMVSDKEPWAVAEAEWIKEVIATEKIPVLGICFGHQLLGEVFGAPCQKHPTGGEWGSYEINFHLDKDVANDPVFGRIANFAPSVQMNVCHSQSVTNIPPNSQITVLGSSKEEPHHFLRFNKLTYGMQGHPEYRVAYLRTNLAEDFGDEAGKTKSYMKDEDDFSAALLTNFFYFAVQHRN